MSKARALGDWPHHEAQSREGAVTVAPVQKHRLPGWTRSLASPAGLERVRSPLQTYVPAAAPSPMCPEGLPSLLEDVSREHGSPEPTLRGPLPTGPTSHQTLQNENLVRERRHCVTVLGEGVGMAHHGHAAMPTQERAEDGGQSLGVPGGRTEPHPCLESSRAGRCPPFGCWEPASCSELLLSFSL